MNWNKINVYNLIKPEIARLKQSGSETASLDCRILLSIIINKDKPLYSHENIYITNSQITKFKHLVEERATGKPVSRITNKRSFWKRDFNLNEETLDPRPDSEVLITSVLKHYTDILDNLKILDLGSGSGCLGLSLLEEYQNALMTFIDISKKSLIITKHNAIKLNLQNRCKYLKLDWNSHDWDNHISHDLKKSKFDIIVCNPPYIPTNEIEFLKKEVKNFDPMLALDGGLDGLGAYKKIFPRIRKLLTDSGKIFVEIGKGQANSVLKLGSKNNLLPIECKKDFSGIVRALIFLAK